MAIRKAERQDVPLLLEFIRGIARFGKMEDEVIASTGTSLPITSLTRCHADSRLYGVSVGCCGNRTVI